MEALLKKAKKSGGGKLQATVIASPKGERDIDELIAFNHELQNKYDALNDDYVALRNKQGCMTKKLNRKRKETDCPEIKEKGRKTIFRKTKG